MPLSVVKRLSLGEQTEQWHSQRESLKMYSSRWENSFSLWTLCMDIEEDAQVPVLLGRPFLVVGAALIDFKKGELTFRVGEEVVHFNLKKA